MKVATKVLQLVYAQDNEDDHPIEQVFDDKEQKVLHKLNEKLQGKTEKQKNPFTPDQLRWAAWVIARLGGMERISVSK